MNDNRDHLRAMHAAYVESSGIPVSLSYERRNTLREFDRRGFTPDDIRAVLAGIRVHINRGSNGYSDASLDWRNSMKDVDTFEERALKIRQARLRKKGAKPLPVVAHTTILAPGETVTRLAPAASSDKVSPLDMKKALHEFAEKLGKGTSSDRSA